MCTMSTRAAGIVLAAGTSSRMGRNKLLLEVGGEPLVRRAAGAAIEAGLDPVLVVVGHQAGRVTAALDGLACRIVEHPGYAAGMTSSLRAGVAALPADAGAAVMILADMPGVSAEMLAAVVDAWASDDPARRPPLVLSDYDGVNAPPTLFDRALFAELLALPDDRCPRRLAHRHHDRAATCRWPAGALADLDRPEDVAAAGAATLPPG
jgi:molybdenum cofactor cytidylyltransferase